MDNRKRVAKIHENNKSEYVLWDEEIKALETRKQGKMKVIKAEKASLKD